MEPLAAVGLASAIAQLVDFSGRLFKLTLDIRNSTHGVSGGLLDLELASTDLHALSEVFRNV